MEKISWKGHASMFGANAMWGLMSPVSKFIMAGGAVTPFVVTDLRIGGAMALFWFTSFFRKPEHVSHKDLMSLFFASLLAVVFNQGCFIFGVSLSSPGDASIITTSMPLWAMILAAFILKSLLPGKRCLALPPAPEGRSCSFWEAGRKLMFRFRKVLQFGGICWFCSHNSAMHFILSSTRILWASIHWSPS